RIIRTGGYRHVIIELTPNAAGEHQWFGDFGALRGVPHVVIRTTSGELKDNVIGEFARDSAGATHSILTLSSASLCLGEAFSTYIASSSLRELYLCGGLPEINALRRGLQRSQIHTFGISVSMDPHYEGYSHLIAVLLQEASRSGPLRHLRLRMHDIVKTG